MKQSVWTAWQVLYPFLIVGAAWKWGCWGAALGVLVLLYIYHWDWIIRGYEPGIKKGLGAGWPYMCLAILSAGVILQLLFQLIPWTRQMAASSQAALKAVYQTGAVLELLAVGAAYPLLEETLFRGMLYARLRDRMRMANAAFVSALFFGLYHGNLIQGLYGFAMGLLLALAFERYHSLTLVTLIHGAMNLASLTLVRGLLMPGNSWPLKAGVIAAVCAICAFAAYRTFKDWQPALWNSGRFNEPRRHAQRLNK